MQKIGILGGTFDPPHIGHLILAEYTLEALMLDKVLFVPVGNHPFKDITRTATAHRLQMLSLAVGDNPQFEISTIDMDRQGPHYSADTVVLIQDQFPSAQLYFIMGGDNLRDLPTWTRPRDLYQHSRIAVMRRSDEAIQADMHKDILPGLAERVDMIDTPLLSIWLSSTHVVERLRDSKSVRYLVPENVLEYIAQHGLYANVANSPS